MENINNIQNNFHDYSDDFKKNRVKITRKLKQLYPTPKDLTVDEKQFIIMWGKDSFPLLSYLRSKLTNSEKEDNYLELYNNQLHKAINKYDNIKNNSILHRRVFNDFFIVDVWKIGVFETPLSTTFDSNSNLEFGDYHITILAPIGTNGAYIEELMFDESYSQHLNEWLFPAILNIKHYLKIMNQKKLLLYLEVD